MRAAGRFAVYGLGGLVGEAVHAGLRGRPIWQRAGAYALAFWSVEAATGEVLRRTIGDVPWGEDYRTHPDNLGDGLIRLSYAPSWAAAGLALEVAEPFVRRLRLADDGD